MRAQGVLNMAIKARQASSKTVDGAVRRALVSVTAVEDDNEPAAAASPSRPGGGQFRGGAARARGKAPALRTCDVCENQYNRRYFPRHACRPSQGERLLLLLSLLPPGHHPFVLGAGQGAGAADEGEDDEGDLLLLFPLLPPLLPLGHHHPPPQVGHQGPGGQGEVLELLVRARMTKVTSCSPSSLLATTTLPPGGPPMTRRARRGAGAGEVEDDDHEASKVIPCSCSCSSSSSSPLATPPPLCPRCWAWGGAR